MLNCWPVLTTNISEVVRASTNILAYSRQEFFQMNLMGKNCTQNIIYLETIRASSNLFVKSRQEIHNESKEKKPL